jgi:hypothetical protein
MKNAFLILGLITLVVACGPSNKEVVNYTSYGAQITSENAVSVDGLAGLMAEADTVNLKLTGTIEKTCKMKGCWMTVTMPENSTMRVTFKDYGFFVPKEGMEGKTVVFQGQAIRTETSVEDLQHFAKDEGKSEEEVAAITQPKKEYTFVAEGVLIQD